MYSLKNMPPEKGSKELNYVFIQEKVRTLQQLHEEDMCDYPAHT